MVLLIKICYSELQHKKAIRLYMIRCGQVPGALKTVQRSLWHYSYSSRPTVDITIVYLLAIHPGFAWMNGVTKYKIFAM